MRQYMYHLLMLFAASGSILIASPCFAENLAELSEKKVSNESVKTTLLNSDDTTNIKSDSSSVVKPKLVVQTQIPKEKPNRQRPVFSRIFPVLTMQQ